MKTLEKTEPAPSAPRVSAQRPFHPKDLLTQVVLQSLAVAPDGSSIVYARRTVEDGKYVRRLWRTTFKGGRSEQLTAGKGNDMRPRYSPDAKSLLFISDRSGKPQVWVMSLAGGEARQVTDVADGVGSAEWSPDGKRLLLLAPSGVQRFLVGKPDDPIARRIRDYTHKVDGAGYRDQFTSAWITDVAGAKPWRLTAPTYDVGGACWSPDGKNVAFLADLRDEAAVEEIPALWTISADHSSKAEPLQIASTSGGILNIAWAPSDHLAFLASGKHRAGWANVDLHVSDGGSRQLAAGRDLDIWNTSYGDFMDGEAFGPPPVLWLDGQNVLGLVARKGSAHPYRFGRDGSVEALAEPDAVCSAIAAGGGRIAVIASTGGPSEVHAVEDGTLRQLTSDGSRWFGPFRRRVERVSVPHPDGHSIDTWLMTARGTRSRGPLVLAIHGGPNLSYGPTPWLELNALADAGFHVIWSNPRGSRSYGEAYAKAVDGRWGEPDSSDLLRVIDWATEQGLADRDRLGVMGLSYGGFMTNWMLGHHPGVFAAAVSENPVTDLLAEYASADFGVFLGREAAGVGEPWDHLNEFLARSPYTRIHLSRAALLLLQAENDLRCPPGNTDMVFTILRSLGREVEMIRYPGESHLMLMMGRPDRRVDRLERIVGWFEKHLGPDKTNSA